MIIDRVHKLDVMAVRVEIAEGAVGMTNELSALGKKVAHMLKNVLNVNVQVDLVQPRTIPRSIGKARRIVDNRKM